jgi:coenzyme F420-reducing hydrogenase gamma subunit
MSPPASTTSPAPRKLRIATCSLAGCFGCHMSLLDIDLALADLLDHIEFDRSPLTDIKHCATQGVDIGLIEGGLCNTENVAVLREFRERCTTLVAVGACAMYGGVPALRNGIAVPELLRESYLGSDLVNPQVPQDAELPPLLQNVLPLHEVVAVDITLPGCPPPAEAFRELILSVLQGRPLQLPRQARRFD